VAGESCGDGCCLLPVGYEPVEDDRAGWVVESWLVGLDVASPENPYLKISRHVNLGTLAMPTLFREN
jgi:hypothetical protein